MQLQNENLLDSLQNDALSKDVPLADTLRKLVALGGQAGSTNLREWASHELRGYAGSGMDLPGYRKPGAVLQMDAVKGDYQIKGQQIGPRMLPEVVREHLGEEVPLGQAIGEIEAMLDRARADGGHLKLTLPGSQDVIALMNHENSDPSQHIVSVYWSLSAPALSGVLDRVRTTLVELIAEMRAGMPKTAEAPSQTVADQAVNVVVHGLGARVNVSSANASGDGSHHVGAARQAAEQGSRWQRIGVFFVGFATIIGVGIALAQWQGWGF